MKKFVKIISVVMCALLLVTGFFFAPKNMTPYLLSSASATTVSSDISSIYDYQAELETDYYGFGDFSIEDIKFFSCFYGYYLKFSITSTHTWDYMFGLATTEPVSATSSTASTFFDYLILNGVGLNMCIVAPTRNYLLETRDTQTINGVTYYKFNCFSNGSMGHKLDIYFSTSTFSVDSNLNVSLNDFNFNDTYLNYIDSDTVTTSQFNSLVDMNSETNFTFDFYESRLLLSSGTANYLYDLLDYFNFGSQGFKQFYTYEFLNPDTSDYSLIISNQGTVRSFTPGAYIFLKMNLINNSYEQKILLYWLGFDVYQPAYRVNNSLIVYNYDYTSAVDCMTESLYTLRKGQDFYNVSYSGAVPNSKYLIFNSNSINNIIFDEYITVDFTFDNATLVPFDFYNSNGQIGGSVSIGFDFNFTYYVEPLVLNNGSYSYSFTKPGYKDPDVKLSLTPPKLYIPFTAWIYNAFVFMIFYCPIVSDLIELLHFEKFMSGLIQIFNMFIDSQIGDFVLGCLSFIVLWGILASLMPKILSIVNPRNIYSSTQFAYDRRRSKEDKSKLLLDRKEQNYQNFRNLKNKVKEKKTMTKRLYKHPSRMKKE